jgi:hypothetical protein
MILTPAVRTKAQKRWLKVLRTLNEFQARLFVADKALDSGRGGISRWSRLAGMSRTTITKAIQTVARRQGARCATRGRCATAGWRTQETRASRPAVATRFAPGSFRRARRGIPGAGGGGLGSPPHHGPRVDPFGTLPADTARRLREDMDYWWQVHRKVKEGRNLPTGTDSLVYPPVCERVPAEWRSGHFRGRQKARADRTFQKCGRPWRRKGRPQRGNIYDFPSWAKGKGIP